MCPLRPTVPPPPSSQYLTSGLREHTTAFLRARYGLHKKLAWAVVLSVQNDSVDESLLCTHPRRGEILELASCTSAIVSSTRTNCGGPHAIPSMHDLAMGTWLRMRMSAEAQVRGVGGGVCVGGGGAGAVDVLVNCRRWSRCRDVARTRPRPLAPPTPPLCHLCAGPCRTIQNRSVGALPREREALPPPTRRQLHRVRASAWV